MTVYQNKARQEYIRRHDLAWKICDLLCVLIFVVLCVATLMEIPAAIDREFDQTSTGARG